MLRPPRSRPRAPRNGAINRLEPEDRAVHDWYRFVLSFPPHLVRDYLDRFGIRGHDQVLDPFCGTGTTLVECKKLGISSVGVEANVMAYIATQTKLDWSPDPDGLLAHGREVARIALAELAAQGIEDDPIFRVPHAKLNSIRTIPPETWKLLLADSISPLPLHKVLVLRDFLVQAAHEKYLQHEQLALAKALVHSISNLQFGPEVGVGPHKVDCAVIDPWLSGVSLMAADLRQVRDRQRVPWMVHFADARAIEGVLEPQSVDAVITSPPYPNEKDYTRTTRLESVLLGLITTKAELRALKHGLVRSNTRGVYKGDDDDLLVADNPKVQEIADRIEKRRIELGKTSGFERLYSRVTRLYFGGMARHLAELRTVLRPGARLAYVVGDQASYLRVMIRTGELLAEIAESLGYERLGIDLFRTRLSTVTREQLREEVVLLRWPG